MAVKVRAICKKISPSTVVSWVNEIMKCFFPVLLSMAASMYGIIYKKYKENCRITQNNKKKEEKMKR
ncbi:MAG: hypothetical protein ACLTWR_01810 [Agathobaculum desmolans]